ncbi:MAG: hypothetical protein JO121_21345 [Deltaproteobacteria bacterium]|nr:hypothetical protein [Deltaproteobacteria bacterium]
MAEYFALRSFVVRQWRYMEPCSFANGEDEIARFAEIIDNYVAVAVSYYKERETHYRDRFLGILGHDLRNPISAILFSATSLASRTSDDDQRWQFASGCHHADWMIASCLGYDGEVQAMNDDGAPVTRVCFLSPGDCQIIDTWNTIGLRGTGSNDFSATDVFVPEARSFNYQLLKPLRRDPLYSFPGFIPGKFGAVPLGVARAALDATIELVRRSSARSVVKGNKFIASHPLREESHMQTGIAQAEAMIGSAKSYLYDQTDRVWQLLLSGQRPTPVDTGRHSIAYINAYRTCREAVDQLYCLAGASVIFASSPLDRLLRDMRTMAQHVLAGPASFEIAGRMLLVLRPTHRDREVTCRGSMYLIKQKTWSGGSGGKGSLRDCS